MRRRRCELLIVDEVLSSGAGLMHSEDWIEPWGQYFKRLLRGEWE